MSQGKGSHPRQGADLKAFAEGWERTFRKAVDADTCECGHDRYADHHDGQCGEGTHCYRCGHIDCPEFRPKGAD